MDWPHPGQTPLPSPRIKFWKSPVGITIGNETYVRHADFDNYIEQLTIIVLFAFEGLKPYLYLSPLCLLLFNKSNITSAQSSLGKFGFLSPK